MLTSEDSGRHSQMPWDTFRVKNAEEAPSSTVMHFKLQLIDMVSSHLHHLFQVHSLFLSCLSPKLLSTHIFQRCARSISPNFNYFFFFSMVSWLSLLLPFVMLFLLSCTFFSLLDGEFCVLLTVFFL